MERRLAAAAARLRAGNALAKSGSVTAYRDALVPSPRIVVLLRQSTRHLPGHPQASLGLYTGQGRDPHADVPREGVGRLFASYGKRSDPMATVLDAHSPG